MKLSTALKKARAAVFTDGVNILFYSDVGFQARGTLCLDNQGSRASQIRRAVARARRVYAERLVTESEGV